MIFYYTYDQGLVQLSSLVAFSGIMGEDAETHSQILWGERV